MRKGHNNYTIDWDIINTSHLKLNFQRFYKLVISLRKCEFNSKVIFTFTWLQNVQITYNHANMHTNYNTHYCKMWKRERERERIEILITSLSCNFYNRKNRISKWYYTNQWDTRQIVFTKLSTTFKSLVSYILNLPNK